MSINKIITNAIKTKWAKTDDFQMNFQNRLIPLKPPKGLSPQDLLDIAIISVDVPQFSHESSNVVIGDGYRTISGIYQPFEISLTFRDIEGTSLRNYFINIWNANRSAYHDEIKSTVDISIDQNAIFYSDECIITAVSQIQISNSNSQIIEFTVTLVTNSFSNGNISNFGK